MNHPNSSCINTETNNKVKYPNKTCQFWTCESVCARLQGSAHQDVTNMPPSFIGLMIVHWKNMYVWPTVNWSARGLTVDKVTWQVSWSRLFTDVNQLTDRNSCQRCLLFVYHIITMPHTANTESQKMIFLYLLWSRVAPPLLPDWCKIPSNHHTELYWSKKDWCTHLYRLIFILIWSLDTEQ